MALAIFIAVAMILIWLGFLNLMQEADARLTSCMSSSTAHSFCNVASILLTTRPLRS